MRWETVYMKYTGIETAPMNAYLMFNVTALHQGQIARSGQRQRERIYYLVITSETPFSPSPAILNLAYQTGVVLRNAPCSGNCWLELQQNIQNRVAFRRSRRPDRSSHATAETH